MRLRHAAVILAAVAFTAGCGGKLDGMVKMRGITPDTSLQMAKDPRIVQTFCPGPCGEPMAVDTPRCPKKKTCGVQVIWRNDYICTPCQGSGRCMACSLMEQPDGKCYNCRGQGVLVYLGKTRECPNCKGKATCPVCKGNTKCDYCEGVGRVNKEVVKQRAAKFVGGGAEDDAPALPGRSSDAPKPAEAPVTPAEEKKQ